MLLLPLAVALLAGTADPVVIAVFELRAEEALLPATQRAQTTRYLAALLGGAGRFHVVAESDLKRAITEKKSESYDACFDESCRIEVGRELAAEKVVFSELARLGSQCVLTLTLFDLERAASERAATERTDCRADRVLSALDRAAAQLTATPVAEQPVAVAPPDPRMTSPTRFRIDTKDPNLSFRVEVIGADGRNHACEQPVQLGTSCSIAGLARGEALILAENRELGTFRDDYDADEDAKVEVVTLKRSSNLFSYALWGYGGIGLAAGVALTTVGIATDTSGMVYGGLGAFVAGGGLLTAGFFLPEHIGSENDTLDLERAEAPPFLIVPTRRGATAVVRLP